MLRSALTAAAAALAVAGVSASAAPDGRMARPRASARVAECSRGPAPESRLAVFRGAMRRVPGTRRMWMRFMLQERVGDGAYRTIEAPRLGTWRKSRPGVRRFAYRQRVLALAEGSAYRTVVSFRWYASGRRPIRRARRRSRACRQPGLLANLALTRVGGPRPVLGAAGAYRYPVSVVNRGRAAAEGFSVSLAVDGITADTGVMNALAPRESRKLLLTGPACASTLTAVADPSDVVRESSEHDNALTVPCP